MHDMTTSFPYLDHGTFLLAREKYTTPDAMYSTLCMTSRLKQGYSTYYKIKTVGTHQRPKESAKKIQQKLTDLGYIIMEYSSYQTYAFKEALNGQMMKIFLVVSFGDCTIKIRAWGDNEEVESVINWLENDYRGLGFIAHTSYMGNNNKINYRTDFISKGEGVQLGRQSFYPWMNIPLEDYFKEFMASNQSILLMYGPPGTGKSTFLRTLMMSGYYETVLAHDRAVVESPALFKEFYEEDAVILACEDMDLHLRSREDGNGLMSTILNETNGVIQHKNKKLVISTNLTNHNKIDSAMLRVGRCFDILEFRELTQDEAEAVCQDVGIRSKDWSIKSKWPLSEILAEENEAQQVVNRFGKKPGFM